MSQKKTWKFKCLHCHKEHVIILEDGKGMEGEARHFCNNTCYAEYRKDGYEGSGKTAYDLRKVSGMQWQEIGEELGYTHRPRRIASSLARRYALVRGLEWPIRLSNAYDGCKQEQSRAHFVVNGSITKAITRMEEIRDLFELAMDAVCEGESVKDIAETLSMDVVKLGSKIKYVHNRVGALAPPDVKKMEITRQRQEEIDRMKKIRKCLDEGLCVNAMVARLHLTRTGIERLFRKYNVQFSVEQY